MENKEKFDYDAAVAELEAIAQKAEDPRTAVEDMEKMIRRSAELVQACRAYLRGAREKVAALDKEFEGIQ
ncbi:MAG: exodeoxyribonuclease VII small subunit [Bacteroidales bacterium]|nr:exodeoxyribonuclease VII small subunit [Bacteroidales bacterium]MDD5911218.1 exodeoxyribonuclease VII small subunit [Bacteroidales bacterium]